ncbi:unnamed protein product [Pelagomonas calceolata]|uniref:MYND-type domain-containing protein n=1 Tax=Pelagomonas calceolata TaxID=35677 RepID=A0A8J2X632_9STRA|nr:unnamed protein product [Pelagomonas calceolata]
MILTTCAACAAPLAHDAPRCVRCHTRYCNATCQHDHWRRGHKQMCKKIHRGGNAEQYNADKKYKEAVAVAVEACADDTKGQTCFICTQALHWKTKEGLVRGCACRGTAGFAHVSCLAEQAKILVAEVEENNLGNDAFNARWRRWASCSLCEQEYHGVVRCALGWACWKTYVGRPETDAPRQIAMNQLGNGLQLANYNEDALSVQEAELAMKRRLGASAGHVLAVQGNIANTYQKIGRLEQALQMRQDVYSGTVMVRGREHIDSLAAANNNASTLNCLRRYGEAKTLLRDLIPVTQRVLGEGHLITLKMRWLYAMALHHADDAATLDDLREAVTTLEDSERIARRVFGGAHPTTDCIELELRDARAALRAREASPGGQ